MKNYLFAQFRNPQSISVSLLVVSTKKSRCTVICTVFVESSVIITILSCVGKKLALKFATKALAHYVVRPVIHSQHMRAFLRIVYEHLDRNPEIGARVINMVSPLSQLHNRIVARGGDLPQSNLLIRENYISNRVGFTGDSGHQILRMFRPYTIRFPRLTSPVENPLMREVTPFLWSGASIGNPLSSSGDLYNSVAGTLTLSNRQRALATVIHWMASSRGPVDDIDSSSVIEELHRLRIRSLGGYVRRISRRFNVELTPRDTYDLYLQAVTGVPVNPRLQRLGIPLPGYVDGRDRFYRSLIDSHMLSRESLIERMTARNSLYIHGGVGRGARNAVVGGNGAVENPEVVTSYFRSICNGVMNLRSETLRYVGEGFRYIREADGAALGTLL